MNRFSARLSAALVLMCLAGIGATVASGEETSQHGISDLRIDIDGIRNAKGVVQYAIYDSARHFPSRTGRVAKGEVPAVAPMTEIVVRGLKPGTYAVAVFHDENLNDAFDRGFLGIPLEDYGFSNDARGLFSAPAFSDAKFVVAGRQTRINITLGR